MPNSNTFQKIVLVPLAVAVFAASPGVFAHTRLEVPNVQEGTTVGHAQTNRVYNQVVISHGCTPAAKRSPTYGTTVVFPNAASYTPIIGVNSNNTGTMAGLAGAVYTKNPASTYYSPLAGIGALINTGGPFPFSNLKVDALGNKDGFWAGGKFYDQTISTYINIPFYSNTVTINPKSCARTVTFELAIADVCDVTVNSTHASDDQVLYWSPIPNFLGVPGQPFGAPVADPTRNIPVGPAYSKYDGYADAAHTIAGDGWGSPATLTVTRNTSTNPLPANCTGNGGLGDDIFVFPSADQINKELPVYQNADQTGAVYWQ